MRVGYAAHRDRALLSEYSEIVDEHGLGQATKFVTPRELRIKLFKQARDKGILSCLKVIVVCAVCAVACAICARPHTG